MTKNRLSSMLFGKMDDAQFFTSSSGKHYVGYLISVQKEDGSGSSFNITINGCDNKSYTFHIRTVD